jgi:peptidoglycan/xylan/chitin deacetylase (PgdA/CDA1 family)
MFDLTLTFDNGPHPDVTPEVLDCLAQRDIRTTFFVVGERLAQPGARRICERAHTEGHWIGNHTWTHSIPLAEIVRPIDRYVAV